MTTLRELVRFDFIYDTYLESAVSAALSLANSMNDNDKELHDKLYTNEAGTDEWCNEVVSDTMTLIPSADEYWLLVEEFITLNTEEGVVKQLMEALHSVEPVINSIGSFIEGQILKDLDLARQEVLQ